MCCDTPFIGVAVALSHRKHILIWNFNVSQVGQNKKLVELSPKWCNYATVPHTHPKAESKIYNRLVFCAAARMRGRFYVLCLYNNNHLGIKIAKYLTKDTRSCMADVCARVLMRIQIWWIDILEIVACCRRRRFFHSFSFFGCLFSRCEIRVNLFANNTPNEWYQCPC